MAHAFGAELDINPWDALLKAVRISAGKVAYIEHVISTATSDLELEGRVVRTDDGVLMHPDTGEPLGVGKFRDLSWWVEKGELWHDRLMKSSKMAIDAGIAAWQVQKIEQEAQRMARVLNAVLEGVEGRIPDDMIMEMRMLMRNELLMIEQEEQLGTALGAREQAMDGPVVDSTARWED
jgi:hypothetical protein